MNNKKTCTWIIFGHQTLNSNQNKNGKPRDDDDNVYVNVRHMKSIKLNHNLHEINGYSLTWMVSIISNCGIPLSCQPHRWIYFCCWTEVTRNRSLIWLSRWRHSILFMMNLRFSHWNSVKLFQCAIVFQQDSSTSLWLKIDHWINAIYKFNAWLQNAVYHKSTIQQHWHKPFILFPIGFHHNILFRHHSYDIR